MEVSQSERFVEKGEGKMKRPCPVCGKLVEWEINEGQITLYNGDRFHSCGRDTGDICPDAEGDLREPEKIKKLRIIKISKFYNIIQEFKEVFF